MCCSSCRTRQINENLLSQSSQYPHKIPPTGDLLKMELYAIIKLHK